jgi:hypothetical protein
MALKYSLVSMSVNQASSFWAQVGLAFNTNVVAKLPLWCPPRQLIQSLSPWRLQVSEVVFPAAWWGS